MPSIDLPRRRRSVAVAALASLALLLPAAARAQAPGAARGARVPADTLSLSLADAVERARRTSDEVLLAAAQVDVTEAQFTTARAGALPQLRLNSAYTHVLQNARAAIVGSIFGQNYTYNTNANLSWQIFQGGRAINGWRAASRLRQAARLDAVEAREMVVLDVQRAYLAATVAERLAGIQVQNLVLSSERVTQVEQQLAAGRAARYDVLRVRVERANLEPLALQAGNEAELAQLELKRLLNIPAEQPLRLTTDVAPADIEVLARQVARQDSLADAAGGDRALIRSATLEREARRYGIRVARADLLPTLTVFAQFGYLALPGNGAFPTRLGDASIAACNDTTATRPCQNNGWFADRQVGVQVSWALFDGGRARGSINLAQAQARLAELQLRLAREQVSTEVARARAELRRARALWEAQRQNATEADEAFRLASLRQNRGLGTQLEVSDAQLALLTAQTNAARATYDVYLASAGLAFALGRPLPLPASSAPAPARIGAIAPAAPLVPAPSVPLRADDLRHE